MSKMMERSTRTVHEFLAEHATEDMSIDEINELLQQSTEQINQLIRKPLTEEDAETAEDYLILAEQAEEEGNEQEVLRLVRKALKLDPEDLDAVLMEIRYGEKDSLNILARLRVAIDQGRRQLEKAGFFDEEYIGEFWGTLETRPYMRARGNYVVTLMEFGMLRQAAREAEDMIRLNTDDNLGMRFTLMHIYAMLEEAELAEALLAKYSEHPESQMLLPLAVLYFKLGDTKKAESYLRKLSKTNDETRQFIRDIVNKNIEKKLRDVVEAGGYVPFSEEELLMTLHDNIEVYDSVPTFFLWAADVLKIKRR